ncbi:MAG: hypothetical protein M0C28_47715 [Candidatus Moduliflexus flocculans]|nr:hypothetical protein [Candidatus Moduliflexus flocculans]
MKTITPPVSALRPSFCAVAGRIHAFSPAARAAGTAQAGPDGRGPAGPEVRGHAPHLARRHAGSPTRSREAELRRRTPTSPRSGSPTSRRARRVQLTSGKKSCVRPDLVARRRAGSPSPPTASTTSSQIFAHPPVRRRGRYSSRKARTRASAPSTGRPTAGQIAFTVERPEAGGRKDRDKDHYGELRGRPTRTTRITHLWTIDVAEALKRHDRSAGTKGGTSPSAASTGRPTGSAIAFERDHQSRPRRTAARPDISIVLDRWTRRCRPLVDQAGPGQPAALVAGRHDRSPSRRAMGAAVLLLHEQPPRRRSRRRAAPSRELTEGLRREPEPDRLAERTASTSRPRRRRPAHLFRLDPATQAVDADQRPGRRRWVFGGISFDGRRQARSRSSDRGPTALAEVCVTVSAGDRAR